MFGMAAAVTYQTTDSYSNGLLSGNEQERVLSQLALEDAAAYLVDSVDILNPESNVYREMNR